jgi:hypothetical protein
LKFAQCDVLPTAVAAAASARPRWGDGPLVDVVETTALRATRGVGRMEAVVVAAPIRAVRRRRSWAAGRRNMAGTKGLEINTLCFY